MLETLSYLQNAPENGHALQNNSETQPNNTTQRSRKSMFGTKLGISTPLRKCFSKTDARETQTRTTTKSQKSRFKHCVKLRHQRNCPQNEGGLQNDSEISMLPTNRPSNATESQVSLLTAHETFALLTKWI